MVSPLLPIRHPDQDFFICDFGNVIPKSDIASMEHPLFALSTKPDMKIREYQHKGSSVRIAPGAYGLATIHDKDILIYCISQMMKGVNQGIDEAKATGAKEFHAPSRTIRFKAHDLLVTTNRGTGGREYDLLKQAFERLAGTRLTTNIKTADKEITKGFGLIDSYEIVVENPKTKRMVELELTLSEWLYNAVIGQEVLSINRDYFRLRKPIERRIYEIARKHCGKKKAWLIGIENLHKKTGSSASLKEFKKAISHIIKYSHLPDYDITMNTGNVIFNYTGKIDFKIDSSRHTLQPDTYEKARKIIGRNFDVYSLESDWLHMWENTGKPTLQSPDGAFINFCKKRVSKD